jgi:hypothetical protein
MCRCNSYTGEEAPQEADASSYNPDTTYAGPVLRLTPTDDIADIRPGIVNPIAATITYGSVTGFYDPDFDTLSRLYRAFSGHISPAGPGVRLGSDDESDGDPPAPR